MKKLTLLILLPFFFTYQLSAQTTHVVDDDGGGDFTTIAAAIAAAATNDIISITGGADNTHTENGIIINKSLIFRGQGQNTTIVQAHASAGSATDRVFNINTANLTNTFEDFTVRHGRVTGGSGRGGGLLVAPAGSSTHINLTRMTFSDNYCGDDGAAISVFSGSNGTMILTDCVLSDNEARVTGAAAGGGALLNQGLNDLQFIRCTISGNRGGRFGGGVVINEGNAVTLFVNCTIHNNIAGGGATYTKGGGVDIVYASSTEFINCTVAGNSLGLSATFERKGAGIDWAWGNLTLTNTIVADNTGAMPSLGNDIYENASAGTLTINTSLVEDCQDCSTAPTYTGDPGLGAATTCGLQTILISGAAFALNSGTPSGGSVPADDICGNSRSANPDLGSYDDGFTPVVPTLGQWAMIILALLMGVFATLAMAARKTPAFAGNPQKSHFLTSFSMYQLPFDVKLFGKVFTAVLLGMICLFAVSIAAFGYEMTSADVPGVLLASPIGAYLIHLWIGEKD